MTNKNFDLLKVKLTKITKTMFQRLQHLFTAPYRQQHQGQQEGQGHQRQQQKNALIDKIIGDFREYRSLRETMTLTSVNLLHEDMIDTGSTKEAYQHSRELAKLFQIVPAEESHTSTAEQTFCDTFHQKHCLQMKFSSIPNKDVERFFDHLQASLKDSKSPSS